MKLYLHVGPAAHCPEIGNLDPQIKVDGGRSGFGLKALEEIIGVMETGDPVIVFAGYPDRTGQGFVIFFKFCVIFHHNSGLFPCHFHAPQLSCAGWRHSWRRMLVSGGGSSTPSPSKTCPPKSWRRFLCVRRTRKVGGSMKSPKRTEQMEVHQILQLDWPRGWD